MSSVRSSLGATAGVFATALFLGLSGARTISAQGTTGTGFTAGARTIVNLDFAAEPVGDVPKGLRPHFGKLDVVDKDGVHMLRASSPSDFVLHLPEELPKNFTIEFDLIPKACCNPVDLMVEGVVSGSRSSVSAQIEWDAEHFAVVGGNLEMFQMDMPDSISAGLQSARTKVALSFEGETIKMYTNGTPVYTLTNRKFVRRRVLHISLGGQDEDRYAVYLASVRVADLAPSIVASNAPQPGPRSASPMPTQPNVAPPQGAAAGTVPAGFTVTVTPGANGPVVSWPPVATASGYTVSRYKIDDTACCSSSSGRGWLTGLSWQDAALPVSGRYVYLVLAATPTGQLRAEATFDYVQPAPTVTPPIAASATVPSGLTVTVTMGQAGPLVSWSPVPNATLYSVDRYKIDDRACCGSSSGRTPATSPWQDAPLPVSGTYVYVVTAQTPVGQLLGQTEFGFRLPGGTSTTQPAPVNAVLVSPTTTGTITPTPTGTTSPATPLATSPTKPPAPTVLSNAAPPTDLTAQGSPVAATLKWTPVPGAVRYQISRAVRGTTTWTALGTPPNYPDASYFRDYFPSHTTTYTYQVAAFQSDGSYGSATVDFTPPTPTDPAGFAARQTGPGQVEFEWDFVAGANKYFLTGPGTGSGVVVFAGAHMPGTKNHHTLSGIPAGTHSWNIATNWEPGGILTASTAWPKATATVTADNPGPRYRLIALGFKAIAQSKDIDDARDGRGDEVYFSAIVNRARLTGIPLPVTKGVNVSMVMTRSHGDEAVSVPYGRIRAGTASATGGIQSGDAVPATLDPAAPTAALQQLTFPLLVWEGELPDSDVVVVHPVLWEDDVNPIVQATWAKALFDGAASGYVNMPTDYEGYIPSGTISHYTADRIYGFNKASLSPTAGISTISNGLEPGMGRRGVPGNPLFQCTVLAFNLTRRPCEAHGVDRPLGLEMGAGGGFSTDWLDRVIVLTRTTVEAALTGTVYAPYATWTRGTFSIKLFDNATSRPLEIEAIATYELFFRIERVP